MRMWYKLSTVTTVWDGPQWTTHNSSAENTLMVWLIAWEHSSLSVVWNLCRNYQTDLKEFLQNSIRWLIGLDLFLKCAIKVGADHHGQCLQLVLHLTGSRSSRRDWNWWNYLLNNCSPVCVNLKDVTVVIWTMHGVISGTLGNNPNNTEVSVQFFIYFLFKVSLMKIASVMTPKTALYQPAKYIVVEIWPNLVADCPPKYLAQISTRWDQLTL